MNAHTKRGRVTAYGFACGYVERYERGEHRVTLLYEHGAYILRGFDVLGHYAHALPWGWTMSDRRTAYALARRAIREGRAVYPASARYA